MEQESREASVGASDTGGLVEREAWEADVEPERAGRTDRRDPRGMADECLLQEVERLNNLEERCKLEGETIFCLKEKQSLLERETVFFPHVYRMQDKQRGAGACAEDSKMKTGM